MEDYYEMTKEQEQDWLKDMDQFFDELQTIYEAINETKKITLKI